MFNNVQTPSPTEAAKTEIIRLFQIECDLTGKRRQKMLDLDAIRHGAAQAVVDGTAGIEDAAARVAQRQTEVAAAEEAIAIARQRRVKAIQERFKIEAGELRASAAKCRQDAAEILKRCEPLLRKLSDLQGLTYIPPSCLRSGTASGPAVTSRARRSRNATPWRPQPTSTLAFWRRARGNCSTRPRAWRRKPWRWKSGRYLPLEHMEFRNPTLAEQVKQLRRSSNR